jgi:hypothetical protein
MLPARLDFSLTQRLSQKARWVGKCLIWQGKPTNYGYGQIKVRGIMHAPHRLSYELYKGTILQGYTIDHLCRHRLCINPNHLEAVTRIVNVMRGNGTGAMNARKILCRHGHCFDRIWAGKRYCTTCWKINHQSK